MKKLFGVITLALLLLCTVVDSGSYVSVDTEKTPVAFVISDDVSIDAINITTNPESFNFQWTYSSTMEIPLKGLFVIPSISDLELNKHLILTSTSEQSPKQTEKTHQPEGLFRHNQGKWFAVNLV